MPRQERGIDREQTKALGLFQRSIRPRGSRCSRPPTCSTGVSRASPRSWNQKAPPERANTRAALHQHPRTLTI